MTSAHLAGTSRLLPLERDPGGEVWLELRPAAEALGWKLTDAGGMLGLCPDPDTCIPVPAEAVRARGDEQSIRLDAALQGALGVVVAADDHHAVVAPSPRDGSASAGGPGGGDLPDLSGIELPDARTGETRDLADGERRTGLYVWASW